MQIHDLPTEANLNAADYVALDNGTTNRKGKLKALIQTITDAIATRVTSLESNAASLALGTEITSGALGNYRDIGTYYVTAANAGSVAGSPYTEGGYVMLVRHNTSSREQIILPFNTSLMFRRRYTGSEWMSWITYVGAPHFVKKTYTYAYSNLAAGATQLVTGTNLGVSTPSGYTPIGFVVCHSGLRYVDVIYQDATATGSSNMIILYNHSASSRSGTATVTVLYAKDTLVTTA